MASLTGVFHLDRGGDLGPVRKFRILSFEFRVNSKPGMRNSKPQDGR